jgi:TonB-linked SusC/RagA family outer membrane protein
MKKSKQLSQNDFRSRTGISVRVSRFFTLLILVGAIAFFQGNVNAQDIPGDNTGLLAAVTNVSTINSNSAAVQQKKITGTVVDEKGEALIGATVKVEGTSLGALTDVNGKFSLDVADPNATLSVSFIGYVAQQVSVAGKTTIDIILVPTIASLDEVVVVGYGTQKKTTLTGSVSAVKGDVVSKVHVPNITNALGGQVAGVISRQQGGQPGSDNSVINIRGVATSGSSVPLIVIDGIVRSRSERIWNSNLSRYEYKLVSNLDQIDPSTIESVTILKDAAAVAPYGMGGANGVMLITTKSGSQGLPTLTFNTYYGTQTPTYYPNLLNAVDYMKLRNEATLNNNPNAVLPFDTDVIANYASLHASDPDKYPDSNTKELVNMWAPVQKHDLQISGGSDKMKYFAGLGFFGQNGMFDKVNYKRYNFNLNLETKVTKTTTINASFIGAYERTNDLDDASSANQLFRNSYKFIPTESIYYSNGLWGQFAGNSPVAVLKSPGYKHKDNNTVLTSLSVEQQLPFIKGLSIKGVFSYDARLLYEKGWHTPFNYYYIEDMNASTRVYKQSVSTQEGNVPAYTYLHQKDEKWGTATYQAYLNYSNSFGKHNVTALVVAEKRGGKYDYLEARRNNFLISVDEMSLGSANKNDYDNGGSSSVSAQMGYVYRLGWNYDSKYMFEASGRYDGHYYFAPGKRWGYFPAFSAGWRISEENFMKSIPWITNMKLRASWGKSGNLAGLAYQYLSGYTLEGNGYAFGSGSMVQKAYVNIENNPNITWEVSSKSNVGFEASLWRDALLVEADFFYEKRSGMLLSPNVTVPLEYGLDLAQQNSGKMDNYGFELTVGTRKEFQNGLRLNVSGNVSLAKNKIVETYETAATYDNPNRRRTGRPLGTVFGYKTLGFFKTSEDINGDGIIDTNDGYNVTQWGTLHPGDIKYSDVSGPNGTPDGKIDSNDECAIGNSADYPLMVFGLTASASWKGFDLNLFFQGAALTSYNTQNFMTYPFFNNNSNADYEYYNNRWTPETQETAKYPICWPSTTSNSTQASDFWQRNASYIRLKNAQFGYTIPQLVIQKVKIKSVRIYIATENLFTISGLKYMDPESSVSQTDGTYYPTMKSYTVGASVTF